ncbi:MAG: hypothetical protein U1F14_05915 [Steroidobacteraceae bacterium]
MVIEGLVCWKCGASLAALTLPLRRLEVCRACNAELHCCRLCEFHDVMVAKQCREPVAEEVKDRTRANFCDYFRPRPAAWTAPDPAAKTVRADLDALFSGGSRASGGPATTDDPAARARAALEDLFPPRRG